MPGPVCSAACSVASPISHARGMSAAAESTNSATSVGVKRVVDEDDERGERDGREQDSPDHGRVPYPRAGQSLARIRAARAA